MSPGCRAPSTDAGAPVPAAVAPAERSPANQTSLAGYAEATGRPLSDKIDKIAGQRAAQ